MPPTKDNTGHGALFDVFPDRPQSLHGGAKFDEGFNLQSKDAPKGRNFDEWGNPSAPPADHGPVWDEWGWKDMPDSHGGILFDEGFGSPSANETSKGPLFDLFEPSTQVKFIYDGQDAEGIVDHVRGDGAVMVTPRAGGSAVEVGLEQFLAYKSPSVDNVGTTADRSQAEAPSAWDATAHGAPRGGTPDPGRPVEAVSEGPGNPDARSEIPADWSTVDHLKSVLVGDDVAKSPRKETTSPLDVLKSGLGESDGWDSHARSAKEHLGMALRTAVGGKPHFERASTHLSEAREHHRAVAYQTQPAMINHRKALRDNSLSHARDSTLMGHTAEHASGGDVHHAGQAVKQLDAIHKPATQKTATPAIRLPSDVLKSYSIAFAGATGVAKDVTVAETAVQAENGAAVFCPECRKSAKPTEDGRCPTCQQTLKAHEGHKIVPREKGDGNGSSEDSSGKGVAEKTSVLKDMHKAFQVPHPIGSKMRYSPLGGPNRGLSTPVTVTHHEPGGTYGVRHPSGAQQSGIPHHELLGGIAKTSTIEDLRKAFGAGGDSDTNSGTTWDGSEHSTGQQKGQATSDPGDVEIPQREHPDSDHHSNMSGVPTTCPHCGEVIAQLDAKTAEGAPANVEPTAHKCLQAFLTTVKTTNVEDVDDALKSLVAA